MNCNCSHYNQHYDNTALKGLCWECHTNPANTYIAPSTTIKVTSLWCLRCQVKLGMIEIESKVIN